MTSNAARPQRGNSPPYIRRLLSVILTTCLVVMLVPAAALPLSAEPAPKRSRTLNVDAVNGSDKTGDGSAESPFATITSALATSYPGETILVHPGVYDEEDFPLELGGGRTLRSAKGPNQTIIDAGHSSGVLGIEYARTPVTIEGLAFVGGAREEAGGAITITASDVLIKDCYFAENTAWMGGAIAISEAGVDTTFGKSEPVPVEGVTDPGVMIDGCVFERNGWLPPAEDPVKTVQWSVEPTMPSVPDFAIGKQVAETGGAVASSGASVTITGCLFSENASTHLGGALFSTKSSLLVTDTVFESNVVRSRAESSHNPQVGSDSSSPADSVPLSKYGMGGAVWIASGTTSIGRVVFSSNAAEWGGALGIDNYADVVVDECDFEQNVADFGGAVLHGDADWVSRLWWDGPHDATSLSDETPEAIPSTQSGPDGLETSFERSEYSLAVRRSTFTGNGAHGYAPGVMSYAYGVMIENCLLAENVGPGAVVYVGDMGESASLLNHTTFAQNVSGASVYMAPERRFGFLGYYGLVSNSVFWDNEYGRGRVIGGDSFASLEETMPDVVGPEVIYSNLEYGHVSYGGKLASASSAGEGNISADPEWVDPVSGDYRLTFGSPCVDTAYPGDSLTPATDIEGTPRPIDGDLSGKPEADMGAFELVPREAGTAERLWGENRFETAIQVSKDYFPTADTVFIARADEFADALSCAGLAGYYNAPVLLTRQGDLPAEIAAEIRRLGATTAFVLGGSDAIWADTIADLERLGLGIERIGGDDRYETAALIAKRLAQETGVSTPEVTFIARGDTWPDALAVSPIAYGLQAPILLVEPDGLPRQTVDVLMQSSPVNTVIVGGKSAVDPHVAQGLRLNASVALERISGTDRYGTAAAISEYAATKTRWARWDVTGLATGAHYADALTGGAGIGRLGGVMLLTEPTTLSKPTAAMLAGYASDIVRLDVLGGPSALADAVKSKAHSLAD